MCVFCRSVKLFVVDSGQIEEKEGRALRSMKRRRDKVIQWLKRNLASCCLLCCVGGGQLSVSFRRSRRSSKRSVSFSWLNGSMKSRDDGKWSVMRSTINRESSTTTIRDVPPNGHKGYEWFMEDVASP